jgi:hypothetical protein
VHAKANYSNRSFVFLKEFISFNLKYNELNMQIKDTTASTMMWHVELPFIYSNFAKKFNMTASNGRQLQNLDSIERKANMRHLEE